MAGLQLGNRGIWWPFEFQPEHRAANASFQRLHLSTDHAFAKPVPQQGGSLCARQRRVLAPWYLRSTHNYPSYSGQQIPFHHSRIDADSAWSNHPGQRLTGATAILPGRAATERFPLTQVSVRESSPPVRRLMSTCQKPRSSPLSRTISRTSKSPPNRARMSPGVKQRL